MSHLSLDDLVLIHTGDLEDRVSASAHLAACEQCRSELSAIARTLEAFDALEPPAMDAAYGQRVWNLIEARLDPPAPRRGLAALTASVKASALRSWWPHAALAAATVGLLALMVYVPGRPDESPTTWRESAARGSGSLGSGSRGSGSSGSGSPGSGSPESAAGLSERVLLTAVSEHLERTGMMLTDLNTAEDAAAAFDVGLVAADLADANRLYRQSASFSGEAEVADLLDDLERVLIEVAHASRETGVTDLTGLRGRLETDDVALRVRLAGTALRDRGRAL